MDISELEFSDWPMEDTRSAVWFARHMLRHGFTPTSFTDIYIRENGQPAIYRAVHELVIWQRRLNMLDVMTKLIVEDFSRSRWCLDGARR